MKGPVRDTATGDYQIITSNYVDGVKKTELQPHFDQLVAAQYPKGVGTQKGGYLTKKFLAAFQSMVIDKKGTDCHTKKTLDIVITKSNMKLFKYMYIVEGNKFVYLDDTTIPKYVGKLVHMRFPLYCTNPKICNRCAGELYHLLGIQNIGLTTARVSSSMLNQSLKAFHDTSIKLVKLNIDDLVD